MDAPGPVELRQMQELAQRVTALRPELLNGDATVGELAWVWAKDYDVLAPFWRHRMWFEDGRLAAWGWACLPYRVSNGDGALRVNETTILNWQTHPERPELLHEILDWVDPLAGATDRSLIVQSGDVAAQAIAPRHGYARDEAASADDGSWHQFNARDLSDIAEPVLPAGFRFLTAADVPAAEAARAHREAWQNGNLTDAAFERVQGAWPYRADLHPLVAAPDGTLAATAIVWLDEATGSAEFEPVGTHPAFRRRGLGAALQLRGMQLARAAGATRMFVACIGAPARPAARSLYESVGFRPISRDLPMIKRAR